MFEYLVITFAINIDAIHENTNSGDNKLNDSGDDDLKHKLTAVYPRN